MLYLDHASTSHPKPSSIVRAISRYLHDIGASPGKGSYEHERTASHIVLNTRKKLSALFSIEDSNLLAFSNNATHSFNILIKGFLKKNEHAVICSNSHNACIRPLEILRRERGVSYDILLIEKNGSVDMKKVESLIRKNTALFVMNHASNVTGVVSEIISLSHFLEKREIPLALDVSQTAGIIPLNIKKIPIDFLVGTGHKTLMGPPGIGFFYAKDPFKVSSLIEGGSPGNASSSPKHPIAPPFRFEAGTLNYLGIAGLQASLEYCRSIGFSKICHQALDILNYLTERLRELPNITLYGDEDIQKKVPIISFNLKKTTASRVAQILDKQHNISVRSGLHCAPYCHKSLNTYPMGTVRTSLGHNIKRNDIDRLIYALQELKGKK